MRKYLLLTMLFCLVIAKPNDKESFYVPLSNHEREHLSLIRETFEFTLSDVEKEQFSGQNISIFDGFYLQDASIEQIGQMPFRYKKVEQDNQVVHLVELSPDTQRAPYSAFAKGYYGSGLLPVSTIANGVGAVVAINASGFYNDIPLGPVVRGKQAQNATYDGLDVMYIDHQGNMQVALNGATVDELIELGAVDSFRLGPALVVDGQAYDIPSTYKNRASPNPRTAICQRENGNWIILVADGRSKEAYGLTYSQMQEVFISAGCRVAYNLDGGGSSALYINGEIVNTPSDKKERGVADIIYFY